MRLYQQNMAKKMTKSQYSDLSVLPGSSLGVPPQFWNDLLLADHEQIAVNALAQIEDSGSLVFDFLNTSLRVNPNEQTIFQKHGPDWKPARTPLLRLLSVLYLLNSVDVPLKQEMIGVQELKDAHFFQGPHEFNTAPLLNRFGHDLDGFASVCRTLGGVGINMADVAFRLRPFPRIPVYYLLWEGDDEFSPGLTLLFDRSVEAHFSADGIWGLVNLLTDILIQY